MTLLLISVVLALLAAGWVVYPLLVRRWGLVADALPAELLDGEARKRTALAALKDVEYDRAAGKLDDADYQEIRTRLEMEALSALEKIEGSGVRPQDVSTGVHSCGFRNPLVSRYCAGCGQKLG